MEPERGRDARGWHMAVLAALMAWGTFALDLEVRVTHALAAIAAAIATDACAVYVRARLERRAFLFDPRSALISGMSVALLLRSVDPVMAAAAATLAMAGKALLRVDGRHIWNPSCFGIVTLLAFGAPVWVSSGQWGSGALLAFAVCSAGSLVAGRARTAPVALAFLFSWAGIAFARALWLGDPLAIPLHQVQSGALLVFAFQMISDPRTAPAKATHQVCFGAAVALAAAWVQFGLWQPNGPLWALYALAPLVALLDRFNLPGGTRRESQAALRIPRVLGIPARADAGARSPGLLRLLRREGGREALQSDLAGGARP